MKNIIMNIFSTVLIIIGSIAGITLIHDLFGNNKEVIIIMNTFLGVVSNNALLVFVMFMGIGFLLRVVVDRDG